MTNDFPVLSRHNSHNVSHISKGDSSVISKVPRQFANGNVNTLGIPRLLSFLYSVVRPDLHTALVSEHSHRHHHSRPLGSFILMYASMIHAT